VFVNDADPGVVGPHVKVTTRTNSRIGVSSAVLVAMVLDFFRFSSCGVVEETVLRWARSRSA
jgi:hypothetical protein